MEFGEEFTGQVVSNGSPYAVAALVVSLLSFALAIVLFAKLKSLTRPLAIVRRAGGDADKILAGIAATVEGVESVLGNLEREFREHAQDSRTSVRHLGLVRYDAFEEVSGNQSFSLCLLDESRSGVVLTYLTSKNFTRSYAVDVQHGEPARELGDEESLAMTQALQRQPATVT
jgi:hypothetical protein